MQEVLNLYKKIGETPLERINRFRQENPKYNKIAMTYAGRLDPMAEGGLIVLFGEEIKQKEKYISLPKVYSFEMLLGVSTDSYDILGKIIKINQPADSLSVLRDRLSEKLKTLSGEIIRKYPPFSSKTVQGKPLFEWAREGRIDEIDIPSLSVFIEDIRITDLQVISEKTLLGSVLDRIALVSSPNFRQKEIIESWKDALKSFFSAKFPLISLNARVSSGTYIRALVNQLGGSLGCGALVFSIFREKTGEFRAKESIR